MRSQQVGWKNYLFSWAFKVSCGIALFSKKVKFGVTIYKKNNKEMNVQQHWQSWSATDIGKRRKYNEDALLAKPELGLWAVADGMGGHKAGDVASQLIVDSLNKLSLASSLEAGIEAVEQCLQQVNTALCELAHREYKHNIVGSTVVVLLCEANRCAVLWAGDSRLYRLRADRLQQLTQDHCPENEGISDSAFKTSNIITRAVGAADELELDCNLFDVKQGDLFLLCTDGLDKEISFAEIAFIMKNYAHEDIVNILINKVLERGARDNISLIVVDRVN
jgi:type VI secretion system protein ImpM